MRRLFLIFIMLMLSVQPAWAAVCAYCPDGCVETSEAAVQLAVQDADLTADDDCRDCRPGGIGMLASAEDVPAPSPVLISVVPDGSAIFAALGPDRPERPKWQRAA